MRDPKNLMWAEACALIKQAEQLHRQVQGGRSRVDHDAALLAERQSVQNMLVDMYQTMHQLRLVVYEASWRHDRGEDPEPDEPIFKDVAFPDPGEETREDDSGGE